MNHTINVPLLRKTLEHITLNPLEWNQRDYFWVSNTSPCGTAGCLAGWSAVLSGVPLSHMYVEGVLVPTESPDGCDLGMVAKRELGLDSYQAEMLFAVRNTLAKLWQLAEEYTGGDIQQSEMTTLLANRAEVGAGMRGD